MSRQREVPQFINIEDKIAFQLTARQLGWIALGAFFVFIAWALFEKVIFIIISVGVVGLVLAMVFVKPYGQSLAVFLKNAFTFSFKPKVYIWRKGYQKNLPKTKKKGLEKTSAKMNLKKIDPQKMKEAIQSLDIYE